LASTVKKTADYTVGLMMGVAKSKKVVIGNVRRKRGRPDEVADLIRATAEADGRRVRIAIARDPGQAGVAQESMYTKLLNGFVVEFSPETGSKEIRARPYAVQVNAGNVEMIEGEWNAAYREELRAFPYGRHDDMVDASSRAHMVLTAGKAPMRIADSVVRPFGESFWYLKAGETGAERLERLQRQAKTLKAVDLDAEDAPAGAIFMGTTAFRKGQG
jgi:predicted phage terminase large subunit-like protein